MKDQEFLDDEWDYCLVLDACRYDVFSGIYDDYLDGRLEKRRSPGSSTPEWASRTFTGDHDVAYFSGNPFINDLGIPLRELKWGSSCGYDWTANDHIRAVVDVWKHGWDDDLGTVPPDSLARSLADRAGLDADTDRTVLHYMQPHAPYLSRAAGGKLTQIREGLRDQDTDGDRATDRGGPIASVGEVVRPRVESALEGSELAQKAGLWLELDPVDLVQRGTRDAALDLYEENLRIVLDAVADLAPRLDGTVIVTADHGEAFGEAGIWEHHVETHIPALTEVPWLVVE